MPHHEGRLNLKNLRRISELFGERGNSFLDATGLACILWPFPDLSWVMDYDYDVFLSYPHEKPCGGWVNDHFLPYFIPQLSNALGRRAAVFVDRTEIHIGQKWPARLKEALTLSRCLVGIWTPMYFQSEWCQCECAMMRYRESQLGFSTNERPDGLVIGIRVNDGIHFPPYAKESHYADFEQFCFDGPAFTQSPLHVDFQRAIVPLTLGVARIVNKAPPWSAEWQTAAWTDEVIARVRLPPTPKVTQPLLT